MNTAALILVLTAGSTTPPTARAPLPCAATARLGGRTAHSLVYDPVRQRVLLFGGVSGDSTDRLPRSLWEWDGTRWSCVSADGPPGRIDAFLAFDRARNKVVLFGGRILQPDRQMTLLHDTWEWDGARWTLADTAGPPARIHGPVEYDPRQRAVVIGGGGGASSILYDVWAWTDAWRQLPITIPERGIGNSLTDLGGHIELLVALPDSTPGCAGKRRAQLFELFADSLRRHGSAGPCFSPQAPVAAEPSGLLLFAGWNSPTAAPETWLFRDGTWSKASTSPTRRRGSYVAYDEHRKRTVLFGGENGQDIFDDTWEWDGATWVRVLPRP